MIDMLEEKNFILSNERRTLPLQEVLKRFTQNFDIKPEQIIIESGQLAIFDGRTFAHDAGKGRLRTLKSGDFEPSNEPDLLLAFDTVKTGYHIGYYDPTKSILEDPGTDAWWEMMDKVKK